MRVMLETIEIIAVGNVQRVTVLFKQSRVFYFALITIGFPDFYRLLFQWGDFHFCIFNATFTMSASSVPVLPPHSLFHIVA
jgi:hypothetical protein